jgi:YfiH family protein
MKRLEAQGLKAPGIVHGFFGREGGVSSGIYASLNCGPGSRDDAQAVVKNRRRVADALGPDVRLVSLSQVHGAAVHVLAQDPTRPDGTRLEGDAMVTATPGLGLSILTADCAPVLLADQQAGVIAAAHAGWKGAAGGVLEAAIAAMEKLGAAKARIRAAIGPCISQDNYEVGQDFRDRFAEARDGAFFAPASRAGHYRFDLPGYATHRLRRAGIGVVETVGACTYPEQNGFFSFRRATHAGEADYGRQISAILLTD